ncbi:MAG: caspase family protein [Zavarzinella sp.]
MTRLFLILLIVAMTNVTLFAAPQKFALLIGINKYRHREMNQPKPLQYAEADVTELDAMLKASGYETVLLTGDSATKEAIEKQIKLIQTKGNSDGVVLVALAGHGVQHEKAEDAW